MSDTLVVNARREGRVGILETDGYINDIAAEKVADVGHALVDEGFKYLAINLEKSRIVNSIGISVLIEVIERVRDLGGKVALCCATPTLSKTFKIMGLLKVADLYETEAEAVQALAQ